VRGTNSQSQWEQYLNRRWPFGFPESSMIQPSETIVIGEKGANFNRHLDLLDPIQTLERQAEDSRHSNSQRAQRTGGSNYAFGDGSVRYIKWPHYLSPVNLWLVTERARGLSAQAGPPP